MPESVSNSAGICAAILVMSPVILFIPEASPSPVDTIVILSTLASGAASALTISGIPGNQLVDDGRLVVFLISLGLHVHRLGFGLALLEDDVGLGFTLRANRGRLAFSFCDQALFLGRGQRLNALALDLGSLQHGGDQFFLAAVDFGFLHLDLLLLLDLLHLDLLGDDLLLHDVGLDVVRLVGLRLLTFRDFEVLRFLDFQVALRFGLLGQR